MNSGRLLKEARLKAAKYCAGKERSPYQVLQKLLEWQLSEVDAQAVLATLIQENYVNEARFVLAYCHDKFEFNKWGKQRIRQELQQLRISGDQIENGLLSIDHNRYKEVLQALAQKKFDSLNTESNDWKRRQKTTAFLVRKGYEMDLSTELVSRLSDHLP